jgi:hypothetical protein
MRMEQGTSRDEVKKWTDVAVHGCRILNASQKVVFVTAKQRTIESSAVDYALGDGYKLVTVPQNVYQRLHGVKDIRGNPIRTLEIFKQHFASSFKFTFVERTKLSPAERAVFDMREKVANLIGGIPKPVKEIRISETMRPDISAGCDAAGLWEPAQRLIIIKRSELRSIEAFAGTLLHEITHVTTGYDDVTRDFENGLTSALGKTSARAVRK